MLSLNFLFFFNCISSAKTFYIGDDVLIDLILIDLKIDLDSDGWQVVRANTRNWGVLQRIVGIARVENNEIMEMIEVYEGLLEGIMLLMLNQLY